MKKCNSPLDDVLVSTVGQDGCDQASGSSAPTRRGATYDAFEHLRRALFWEPDQIVAMLTFYADHAGNSHEHEYLLVAGYIGTVAQWDSSGGYGFCSDWRLRLAKAGLNEFHASEFFPGSPKYASWAGKQREGERKALLRDLAQIIHSYTLHSFMMCVHVPSWNRLNQRYLLRERRLTPFPLCARSVVGGVRKWCRANQYDPETVEYIFDQGSEDWGMFVERMQTDHGISPIPRDRRKIRPLQAADWLAYEAFKEFPQSETGVRQRKPRDSFIELLRLPSTPTIYRESDLERFCRDPDANVPERI